VEKSKFSSAGIRTPYPPARSVVATTELFLFLLFDSRFVNVRACVQQHALSAYFRRSEFFSGSEC